MEVFGRTNEVFPATWWRPVAPGTSDELDALVEALAEEDGVVDVSSAPGLWGGRLRESKFRVLIRVGGGIARATDANHATDLVQAELIENLSCLGRTLADFVALRIERPLEEFQIDGALRAFELAREEGFVRFFALAATGKALAVRGVWQFHDAFEVLVTPAGDSYEVLSPVARSRRVGVVVEGPAGAGEVSLRTVRTASELGR